MKFQFTQLQPNSIRVFRFSDHATSSFVQVWLEHLAGNQFPGRPYAAITFLPKHVEASARQSITLNGRSFLVPGPLFGALQTILTFPHESKLRYWAEAICVNHADVHEHGQHHSTAMLAVEHAEKVFLWLGQGDKATEQAFATIQRYEKTKSDISLFDKAQTDGVRLVLQHPELQDTIDQGHLQGCNVVLLAGTHQCSLSILLDYLRSADNRVSDSKTSLGVL